VPTLKLRQDNVRTVPYQGHGGKHQCVYWDEALESFGLRVYPTGRRVYVCAYRVNTRKRLARLGRADAVSLDQARKKAMTYLAKAANHEDPQSNIEAQRQLKTIDELVEAYIEGHAKKKTWKEDRSYLNRHVLSKLSGRLAVSLVTADIEVIHSQLQRRNSEDVEVPRSFIRVRVSLRASLPRSQIFSRRTEGQSVLHVLKAENVAIGAEFIDVRINALPWLRVVSRFRTSGSRAHLGAAQS